MQMSEIYSLGCFQVFKQGGASTAHQAQWGAFGCKFLWLSNSVCMSVTLPKSASILHPLLCWLRSTFQSLLGLLGLLLCKQAAQGTSVITVDSSVCINFSPDLKTVNMSKPGITSSSFTPPQDPDILPFQLSFWGLTAPGFAVSNSQPDGKKTPPLPPPSMKHQGDLLMWALSWTWNEVFNAFSPPLGIFGHLSSLSRRL